MLGRYCYPEMQKLWKPEMRFAKMLEAELAIVDAWAKLGEIPQNLAESIRQKARFDIDKGLRGIITPDQFIKAKRAIATHENSSVLSPDEIKDKRKMHSPPPKALLLGEDGSMVETNLPGDIQDIRSKLNNTIWKAGEDPNKTATIGSFNIEWLGMKERSEEDYKAIAQVIKDSGAQIMGIEEIAKLDGLRRVMKHLPNYGYILGKSGQQMLGIIFDKTRVKYDKNSVDQLDDVKLGRRGLRPPLKVYMQADKFDFTLVVLHLKASFDDRSMEIRNEQAKEVNKWLVDHLSNESDKDLIIVGDYNDFIGSDALNQLNKGENLEFVTQDAEADGMYSHVRYNNIIDHGAVSTVEGGANEEFIPGSVRTIDEKKYVNYMQRI